MGTNLKIHYDNIGDILYLDTCQPYPEQESDELDLGIVARFHPQTAVIENLEILFFTKRLAQGKLFELPILAQFWAVPREDIVLGFQPPEMRQYTEFAVA